MLKLEIESYRTIQSLTLETEGLTLIVGPNGAGKSTIFRALNFIHNTITRGEDQALILDGGSYGVPHWLGGDPFISITIGIIKFESQPLVIEGQVNNLHIIGKSIIKRTLSNFQKNNLQKYLENLIESSGNKNSSNEAKKFAKMALEYKNNSDFDILKLKQQGSPEGPMLTMSSGGHDVFTVLRNWQASVPHRKRYEFVIEHMRRAFSPVFHEIGFQMAGQTLFAQFYAHGVNDKHYYASHAAKGVLLGLMHLTAIASIDEQGLASIDDIEDGLHPHALRVILDAAKSWCERQDATLLLASQSTEVLDYFSDMPQQVFVMRPAIEPLAEGESQLVRLTDEFEEEWLRHFSLGDLYGKDFGEQLGEDDAKGA